VGRSIRVVSWGIKNGIQTMHSQTCKVGANPRFPLLRGWELLLQISSFALPQAQIGAVAARYAYVRGSAAPKKVRQWAANSSAIGLNLRLAKVASTSRLFFTATLSGRATNARPS